MSPDTYGYLADLVAVLHLTYAAMIVVGLALILLGRWLHWKWVRNPWIRSVHLGMILIVVYEAWAGITCPLTVWETQLRTRARQPFDGHSFLARTIHQLLFFDAAWWVFTACYTVCGALVVASLVLVPPRWSAANSQNS